MTKTQNPNSEQGFVYAFAKSPTTGEPIVHNELIGSLIVVNAFTSIDYGVNPFVFRGLGDKESPRTATVTTCATWTASSTRRSPTSSCSRASSVRPGSSGATSSSSTSRAGAAFDASIQFLIYNDNEEVFSKDHEFRCWQRIPLSLISGSFDQDFLASSPNQDPQEILGAGGIESGWFRINGTVANSISHSILDPAILGVLVETVRNRSAADLPFERGSQANGDLYPTSIAGDLSDL